MTTRTTTSGSPDRGGTRRSPQRTCVACRRTGDQSSFARLVRTPEGTVVVDENRRRLPGRGAYLCRVAACWERGLRGPLAGSLRTTLTEANRETLRAFAGGLPPTPAPETSTPLAAEEGR